jgi:hypothetical protein
MMAEVQGGSSDILSAFLSENRTADSSRLIPFTDSRVVPGVVTGTYILIVTGEKPFLNMEVSLIPRIYVVQPEYWEIEVVGVLSGIGLPATEPYSVFISLEAIRGTRGITVVGNSQEISFDVPPSQ